MTAQTKFLGLAVVMILAAVLVSGCGRAPADQSGDQNGQNQNNNEAAEPVVSGGEYSINELLSQNKPMKCSWKESVTSGSEVTNIIYISGKKFYQDVTMGDVGHAYSISDGEYLYIWNDFTGVASKAKLSELEKSARPEETSAPSTAGLDQKRNFVCEKWAVDNSIFNPPQGKDFKDITQELGQAVSELQGNSEESKRQICDMCQKAPTQEIRDNCLKEAQCN